MMDSSNSASTSTTTSATCTSSASSVPSSQPSSPSTLLLPPHVTAPSSQQALSPSLFGQSTTSLGVIPQPDTSSVTHPSTSTSVTSTQPILLSSWSLPPYVTTTSSQQVLSPSASFGQNSKSSVVIPQPATLSTAYPSTSISVSSSQPIPSSSRSLPPYVTSPSSQQALSPSSLFGQNCTSSEVISQPATLRYQSSPQVRPTSAMSPTSISSLPSTSFTVSAFPPHLSVPSVNARILSSHLPPGSAVIPQSPAASCHEVPSSGQTMHAPSASSLFQSSELPLVSSTLSSSLPQFLSSSSCTVSSSVNQSGTSLPCIGSVLTAQHPSAPSFLQLSSPSSGVQVLTQRYPAPAIQQFPPGNTCSVPLHLFGGVPSSNQPSCVSASSHTLATIPVSHGSVLLSQGISSSLVIDPDTLGVYAKYGLPGQSSVDWLNSLHIQRNVESLAQVKDIWELGSPGCPPLKDWTALMRNYKSSKGKNTSIYSQRKFIYNFFKQHGFDVNSVFVQYKEVKPGKLYKLLNTKQE